MAFQIFADVDLADAEELGYTDEDDLFRFYLSSRRLLVLTSNLSNCRVIHTDATYKLNWQGYPGLIIGCSDMDKHFHPFLFAVTSCEKANDFKFIFTTLQAGREFLKLPPLASDLGLMADAAFAIENGFHAAGYIGVRAMCWFHVTKALKTRFLKLDNSDAADLNEYICYMQRSQTPSVFKAGTCNIYIQLQTSNKITNSYITLLAASLFLRKWSTNLKAEVQEFVVYFEGEWLVKHPNWCEGYNYPHRSPSTNNGNEAINAIIKKEDTFGELLPISTFLATACNLVRKWSVVRDPSNNFQRLNLVLVSTQ